MACRAKMLVYSEYVPTANVMLFSIQWNIPLIEWNHVEPPFKINFAWYLKMFLMFSFAMYSKWNTLEKKTEKEKKKRDNQMGERKKFDQTRKFNRKTIIKLTKSVGKFYFNEK